MSPLYPFNYRRTLQRLPPLCLVNKSSNIFPSIRNPSLEITRSNIAAKHPTRSQTYGPSFREESTRRKKGGEVNRRGATKGGTEYTRVTDTLSGRCGSSSSFSARENVRTSRQPRRTQSHLQMGEVSRRQQRGTDKRRKKTPNKRAKRRGEGSEIRARVQGPSKPICD